MVLVKEEALKHNLEALMKVLRTAKYVGTLPVLFDEKIERVKY